MLNKTEIFENVFESINSVFVSLSKVFLFTMMLIITFNAFGRYQFNSPIPGSFAITELYLMVGLVFFSIGYLQFINGNVNVDVIAEDLFEKRTRIVIRVVYLIASTLIISSMAFLTGRIAVRRYVADATLTGIINIPTWGSWAIVSLGLAYLAVVLLFQFVEGTIEIWHGGA